jgi:hypothetical protein
MMTLLLRVAGENPELQLAELRASDRGTKQERQRGEYGSPHSASLMIRVSRRSISPGLPSRRSTVRAILEPGYRSLEEDKINQHRERLVAGDQDAHLAVHEHPAIILVL